MSVPANHLLAFMRDETRLVPKFPPAPGVPRKGHRAAKPVGMWFTPTHVQQRIVTVLIAKMPINEESAPHTTFPCRW